MQLHSNRLEGYQELDPGGVAGAVGLGRGAGNGQAVLGGSQQKEIWEFLLGEPGCYC